MWVVALLSGCVQPPVAPQAPAREGCIGHGYRQSASQPRARLYEVQHVGPEGELEFVEYVRDGDRGWADAYIYDVERRRTGAVRHVYADDEIEEYSYGYDDAGNFVHFTAVVEGQTVVDALTYDAGREVRRVRSVDGEGFQYTDTVWTTTWDGDQRTREVMRTDQRLWIATWDWSSPTEAIHRVDDDGDGTIDREYAQIYDADGRQVFGSQTDGEVHRTWTWVYDASGNPTLFEEHADGPGGWESVVEETEWLADGRRAFESRTVASGSKLDGEASSGVETVSWCPIPVTGTG